MPKKYTIKEFKDKAKSIHGDKYDYDKSIYVNNNTKLIITCPNHGDFKQIPRSHLSGSGCRLCKFESYKTTIEEFITKAKSIHGNKYDYSKVNYDNAHTKVNIICPEHGEFEQTPNKHLKGHSCSICNNNRLTTDVLLNQFISVHGDKYDYSNVDYISNHNKVIIGCSEHGNFEQSPHNHKKGKGCPKCKTSKGELEIINLLTNLNVNFIHQHKFNGCKYKHNLIFDFYLPEYNTCIEYNGRQHYEPVGYFGGDEGFKKTVIRDKIKREYCIKHNIPLIEIKFDENIENILIGNIPTIF